MHTNEEILAKRVIALNSHPGARVGDFLKLSNGNFLRFSHSWGWEEGLQTCIGGSFYLGDGYCSFSGGLYPTIESRFIIPEQETKLGDVWFFDKDIAGGGRDRHFGVEFRVFKINDENFERIYVKKWFN